MSAQNVTELYDELRQIEKRIKASEGESVVDRWEFGRALVQRRKGKQLPRGVVAAVVKEHRISRSEIHRRMQLADKFTSKDEVSHAWDTCGSWRQIVKTLPKEAAAPKGTFDERIEKRLNRIIDDAEAEGHATALAELLRKAIERVEPSNNADDPSPKPA